MAAPKSFLDACVLYPPLARGLLLCAASEGLIAPAWSPRVVEEWARAALRDHGPEAERAARDEAAAMERRWPEGLAHPDPQADLSLTLPDPDDVHVLSAAMDAGADFLVTFNLRDFPAAKVRALGVVPIHPDALLWEQAGRAPEAMSSVLARALGAFPHLRIDPQEAAKALRRAGLPRLGKMLKKGELSL